MKNGLPLFPAQASTDAVHVDRLYFYLVAISVFFTVLIVSTLIVFAVRYRRRPGVAPAEIHGSLPLELIWSGIPLLIVLTIFWWGASVFFRLSRPPDDADLVHVVGKRWMWKLQHANGRREINELHVPVGRAIRLNMTSEDVIHSFYVPAFRTKADVLPGRYTTLWFRPTKPGRYHLFCAEYCGTQHSGMIGWLIVLEPSEFQDWLAGGGSVSMASAGEKLFRDLGCVTCHAPDGKGRGPVLNRLYGSEVRLKDGSLAVADEEYIRESILDPSARITAGYEAVMPTFRGLANEEGVLEIIEYLKSLRAQAEEIPPVGTEPAQ